MPVVKVWVPRVSLEFVEQNSGTVLAVAASAAAPVVAYVADALKREADAAASGATDPTTRTLLALDAERVRASIDALVAHPAAAVTEEDLQ